MQIVKICIQWLLTFWKFPEWHFQVSSICKSVVVDTRLTAWASRSESAAHYLQQQAALIWSWTQATRCALQLFVFRPKSQVILFHSYRKCGCGTPSRVRWKVELHLLKFCAFYFHSTTFIWPLVSLQIQILHTQKKCDENIIQSKQMIKIWCIVQWTNSPVADC